MASDTSAPVPAPSRIALVNAVLPFGMIALLIFACARIVTPFVSILLWSLILAVMIYPLHLRMARRLTNKWSAVLIGVVGVAAVAAPMVVLATSLATSISALVQGLQAHTLVIPPPPPKLADLPLIGQKLADAWALVASNFPAAVAQYGSKLKAPAATLATFAGRLAAGELAFILSIVISAILIAYGEHCISFARRLMAILTGSWNQGVRLVALTSSTIRGVAVGVIGVAAIQALLVGVAFFVVGLPGAAFLTLAVFLLGIVQVPATLLTIPVIIYVFATKDTGTAVIFMIYAVVAGLSDNVLKPLLLGRGLEVPMPVILIGVIGGMVADGLLGMFIGPVILSVGYVLFTEWMRSRAVEGAPPVDDPAT